MASGYFYVYILANPDGMFYVGVTNDIKRRTAEHGAEISKKSYTSQYGCKKLVYIERLHDPALAILREKQIKGWVRKKKEHLIKMKNPSWRDLSESLELPEARTYE